MIVYEDMSRATDLVTLEVLGLAETLHASYDSDTFVRHVDFDGVPTNGWRAHPVVFAVTHRDLGDIIIKIQVHDKNEPAPPVIYGNAR